MNIGGLFTKFASEAAKLLGRPIAFVVSVLIIIVWGMLGPLLDYSDTWQLVINTGTTIITFLMVFIIQNTQNRDNAAIQIKLDAIMEKLGIDEDDLFDAEEFSDKKLEKKKKAYHRNV